MSIKTQFNLSRCVRLHRHHRRHGLDFYLDEGGQVWDIPSV